LNNADFFRKNPRPIGRTPPPTGRIVDRKNKNKNKRKSYKESFSSTLESGQSPSEFDVDLTLIPANNVIPTNDNDTNLNRKIINGIFSNSVLETVLANTKNTINIDEVFPAPNIIIRALFELYKDNKLIKERDSALLDRYVKLLFNKFN